MKPLIITEKPDVAKHIAAVILGNFSRHDGYLENEDYVISWAVGHLIGLGLPEDHNKEWEKWDMSLLPMIPSQMVYKVYPKTKPQFQVLKTLIHREDVSYIINAGDDGREGEYIQRLIYDYAKNQKPIKRLCLNSVSENAIRSAFQNLKNGHDYDGMYASGKGRAWADALLGWNFSRLISLKYNAKGLSIGRVQTPTLGMIYFRDKEINEFVSKPFYQIQGLFNDTFPATWYNEDGDRFNEKTEAEQLIHKIHGKDGVIRSLEKKAKTQNRPMLYSLNSLQAECIRRYGYTSDIVLEIAQSLYETHKITTYPRTESEVLSSDMKSEFYERISDIRHAGGIFEELSESLIQEGLNIDSHVINDKKVSDHHAIIINENFVKYDLSRLSEKESNVLKLILARMLLAVSPKFCFDETAIVIDVSGETFRAKSNSTTAPGWKRTEHLLFPKEEKAKSFVDLSSLREGSTVSVSSLEILSKKTTPPKPFTEADLIEGMEKISRVIDDKELKEALKERGLGTTATRAAIIKILFERGYIERGKGKVPPLIITERGKSVIQVAPDELKTPYLSAEWEIKLKNIENGSFTLNEFMDEIKEYISKTVEDYRKKEIPGQLFANQSSTKEAVGTCPWCGNSVYESEKSFYCSDYKNGCKFSLWKENSFFVKKGKKVTKLIMASLLNKGETMLKNCTTSKGDKTYDCIVRVRWENPYPQFDIEFVPKKSSFKTKKKGKSLNFNRKGGRF